MIANIFRLSYLLLFVVGVNIKVYSQDVSDRDSTKYDSISYGYIGFIYLDSIVVTAKKSGFDVSDFIRMVTEDNSFYRAFKNLRFSEYDFKNDIEFYKKNGSVKAAYKSINHQTYKGRCRSMYVKKEIENRNFYKRNGKNKYYTGKMYDRVFYTHGTICDEDTTVNINFEGKYKSKIDKYISELKKLIFSPGQKVDVPFVGSKMAIFSSKMSKYYDYSIKHTYYQDTIPCYMFSAVVKPEFQNRKENKTVIKYLHTYFAKKNLQIVARNYHLKYKNPIYDFDVKMDVKLKKKGRKYFPTDIEYKGNWHVLFRKRERCSFHTYIYGFK